MPDIIFEIKGMFPSFASEALEHANEAVEQSLNGLIVRLQESGCTLSEIIHSTVNSVTQKIADASFLSMNLQLLRGLCNGFSYGDVGLDSTFRQLLVQWMNSLQMATSLPVVPFSPVHP